MTSEARIAKAESEAKRQVSSKSERQALRERAAEAWRTFQKCGVEEPAAKHYLNETTFDPDAPMPEWWVREVVNLSIFFGRFAAPEATRMWFEHWERTKRS